MCGHMAYSTQRLGEVAAFQLATTASGGSTGGFETHEWSEDCKRLVNSPKGAKSLAQGNAL